MKRDGPLAYEEISSLRSTISNPFYPNVKAIADKLAGACFFLFYRTVLLILKGPRWKISYVETSIMMKYNNKY